MMMNLFIWWWTPFYRRSSPRLLLFFSKISLAKLKENSLKTRRSALHGKLAEIISRCYYYYFPHLFELQSLSKETRDYY